MKLSILSIVALTSSSAAKGEYDRFALGAKASKRSKSHGSKASKNIHLATANIDGTTPLGNSFLIDEGGRHHPKNSEDGGLMVEADGTAGAGGGEGDDLLLDDDAFAHDDAIPSEQERFDPVHAMFDWLTQCTEADLDKDSCLVASTLNSLVEYSSHDDDATFPSKLRRVLQQEEECLPDLTQQDLRYVMNDARAKCNQVSDQHFEGILEEFWKVFSSESCWNELCNSPDIFLKLMFDHAMQCADVEFDECIADQIFSILFGFGPLYDDDDDVIARRLQNVDELDPAFVEHILMAAQGHCAELGVEVIVEDVSMASADLVKLFTSHQCWGFSEEEDDDLVEVESADVVDGNITSFVVNGTSASSETTSSTQPAGISPTNDAHDTDLAYDGASDEANEEYHSNATTVDEQDSFTDDGVSFSNGESLDDDEATKEENLTSSISEENDITAANQTSIEGDINGTSAANDDDLSLSTEGDVVEVDDEEAADTSTSDGGEGEATSTEEDHPSAFTDDDIKGNNATNYHGGEGTSTGEDSFSPSISPENGTALISNSSNATISAPPDNSTGSISTPQVSDESCDVGPRSGVSERSIELPYFYIVETIVLDGVADEIEGMLHLMLCINGVDRRLSVESGETSIVALESTPKDVVSDEYVCVTQSTEAQSCNVIEGMSTLIVEGPDNSEQEDELTSNFYLQLEEMFDMFSSVEDPNIVSLEYIGSDPSSLMTRADLQEEVAASDDSSSLFKIIAIGASVVTFFMLIVGAWKMKGKHDDDGSLDGKPIDDKSLAVETAAMTTLTGFTSASGLAEADDTSSDISSTTDAKTDAKEFYKNKAFVLAEEEEGNWRNLGILPNQLDDIREEFSHSGSEMADEKSM